MSSPSPPSPRRRASPPLPSAHQLPPKKRWALLSRTAAEPDAATVPTPPMPVVVPQIHEPTATAAAIAGDVLASPTLVPQMHAAASSPAAVGQKLPSSPPPLAGDQERLHAPPPPPGVEGKQSAPPPAKRVRKVVRKVRKVVKRLVPKTTTTTTTSSAAAPNGTNAAAQEASSISTRSSSVGEEETTAGEAGETVAGDPVTVEKKNTLVGSTGGEDDEKVEVETGTTVVSGRKKRMREVFVGGLDVNAKEEDVRAALSEAGEVTEVRMVMDAETPTKNRGYSFVQYREAEQAKKAIAELGGVKICGKECRIQPLEGNGQARVVQRAHIGGYTSIYYGENWPTLGDNFCRYISVNPPVRNGINASYSRPTSSSGPLHHGIVGYSPLYHHGSSMYQPDSSYFGLGPLSGIPMRQASSRKPGHPHGSRH